MMLSLATQLTNTKPLSGAHSKTPHTDSSGVGGFLYMKGLIIKEPSEIV